MALAHLMRFSRVRRRLLLLSALAILTAPGALASPAHATLGSWNSAWGRDVNGGGVFGICTVAASCHVGSTGGLGGQMNLPFGTATDSAGFVYVVERNNHRIDKFDASGNWLRAWGKNVNGGGVFGICTSAASCSVGTAGGLGGEMNFPEAIATDPAGYVYVDDRQNNRIQKFDSSGNWLRAWGMDVNGGGVFGICTSAPSCNAGTPGGLGGEMDRPQGVATDSAGNVYVADLGNDRIQKFDSSGNWLAAWGKGVNGGSAFGICTVAASCSTGSPGGLGGEMDSPFGIATDHAGNVYVAELGNDRIQKFDSSGNWLRAWGKDVNGGGAFGICTSAPSCNQGSFGALGGELFVPGGLATDSEGNVYVNDSLNHRVQKFDSSGNWLSAWGQGVDGGSAFGICTSAPSCKMGTVGGMGGAMNNNWGLGTDAAGDLYVADTDQNRIQRFHDPVLSVSISGAGTVSGSGIACPATCSQSYLRGTPVALTATPGAGSRFTGWSSTCSATGACSVTMSADQSVVATFATACIVPALKGKTYRKAYTVLRKSHCRSGRVKRLGNKPRRVKKQSQRPGTVLPARAKVNLRVRGR
jgi:hypothetical protein